MPRPDPRLSGPDRANILEEISGDVEAMREELMRRGMDSAAATEEALRLLAPSEAAIAALASVHEPLYASLARRFSSGMRLAEWMGLVGVTFAAVVLALGSLIREGVLQTPSPFLAPLLAVTVAVVVMAGRKAIQLHVARDHAPERLRSGMGALLVASGLGATLGFAGAAYELLRLAARLEAQPTRAPELVLPWLVDTSILVATGLVTALLGGLAWFLLQQKISSVEAADRRAARAWSRASALTSLPSTGVSR